MELPKKGEEVPLPRIPVFNMGYEASLLRAPTFSDMLDKERFRNALQFLSFQGNKNMNLVVRRRRGLY